MKKILTSARHALDRKRLAGSNRKAVRRPWQL